MLLFLSYGLIIVLFGFIYLVSGETDQRGSLVFLTRLMMFHLLLVQGMSVFGSKVEVNPDGSIKTIAFCEMDVSNHMEALYFR